jgi:periplasmic divalent cation tolerance protein
MLPALPARARFYANFRFVDTSTAPVIVLTSCPAPTAERDVAAEIAQALVEERLAACVSVLPGMHSTYRWKGEICVDGEVLCLIKTTADRAPGMMDRLKRLHPYEVPEMLVVEPGAGWPPYLAWLVDETRPL